jgi:hypothetical protein
MRSDDVRALQALAAALLRPAFDGAAGPHPLRYHATASIPRLLHRTTDFVASCIPDTLNGSASGWEQTLVNSTEALAFVASHFAATVAHAYEALPFSANKADLYRYCRMYIDGGVYLDIKSMPLVHLNEMTWGVNALYVHSASATGLRMHNGVLMSPRGNPLFLRLIADIVANGDSHDYHRIIKAMYATLESQNYRLREPYGVQIRPDGSRVLMLQEKFTARVSNSLGVGDNSQICRDAQNRTDRYRRCAVIYNGTRPLLWTRHWGYPDAPEWARCVRNNTVTSSKR